jgi:hypothetical protein
LTTGNTSGVKGSERETGDGGRWVEASEPVEEDGEVYQGRTNNGDIA